MKNKVDPNYDVYRRQKSSIKSCLGHKYVYVYEVQCWTVALKSWYLYFLPQTPETMFGDETLRNFQDSAKMHFWSKFWNPDFNRWVLIARTNSQAQNGVKFWFWSWIRPWRSRSITPKNIRDLNHGLLHQCQWLCGIVYTYGPNLVILAWMSDELSHGQSWWQTDGQYWPTGLR